MSKLSKLGEQFFESGKLTDCPVYEMHGHMGTAAGLHLPVIDTKNTVKCMDRAGVKKFVFSHHLPLQSNLGNSSNIDAVREYPDKLRAYCGINPNYPESVKEEVETYDQYRDVYVGFKLIADYHGYKLTDERYIPALEKANSDQLLVLLHTWGGSEVNGYEHVYGIAERYPKARFILGHSLWGEWDNAISIIKQFPNTHLEICAITGQGVLEKFVENLGSDRILYGTDFPWFDFHYYIGIILGADISDEDRRNIFYKNAQKLLGE